ncbi:MAG: Uma2 family endonuclease [Saprospiraceae bacterium]
MDTTAPQLISQNQYLLQERQSAERKEYENGTLIDMGGASLAHVRIVRNLLTSLWVQSQQISDLEILSNDMRVHAPLVQSYFYPDVIGVLGEPIMLDEQFDNLTNPSFIIEVLSEGTETRDRVRKFEAYRSIPSFQEYLLISQKEAKIESFYKNEIGDWVIREPNIGLETDFQFQKLNLTLALAQIYEQVQFS